MKIEYHEKCTCGAELDGTAEDQVMVGMLRMRLEDWKQVHKVCVERTRKNALGIVTQAELEALVSAMLVDDAFLTTMTERLSARLGGLAGIYKGDPNVAPIRPVPNNPGPWTTSGTSTSPPTWTWDARSGSQTAWTISPTPSHHASHSHTVTITQAALQQAIADLQDEAERTNRRTAAIENMLPYAP